MRRSDAVKKLQDWLDKAEEASTRSRISFLVEELMTFLEKDLGMRPPAMEDEYWQALNHVYYETHPFMWHEDLDNDPKLTEALKEIQE